MTGGRSKINPSFTCLVLTFADLITTLTMNKPFTYAITFCMTLLMSFEVKSNGPGLFVINTAIKLTHRIDVVKDIAYGPEKWQQLNVYPQPITAPVVLFIHGGGWHKGNKDLYHFVADALVRRGFAVVIPDYIKYPEGRFPSFVEDAAIATAWVKNHITDYGGDPDQIILVGHSAGAHTGALLATDQHYLKQVGMTPRDIAGFVGLAGPYNFTPTYPRYVETFGPENFEAMLASNHIDGDEPPILILHSKGDKSVHQFNYDTFKNRLEFFGMPVKAVLFEDIGHAAMILKIHPWFADEINIADHIVEFQQQLAAQRASATNEINASRLP